MSFRASSMSSGVREASANSKSACSLPRLFLQDLHGGVARLRIITEGERDQAKLELYFRIVRLQFRGFLEQRIGLQNLSLVEINDAQLAQRRRILRGKSKHVAIFLLGFVVLPGGKSILGARQTLLLGGFLFGTAGTRDSHQGKHEDHLPVARSQARDHGSHGMLSNYPNPVPVSAAVRGHSAAT